MQGRCSHDFQVKQNVKVLTQRKAWGSKVERFGQVSIRSWHGYLDLDSITPRGYFMWGNHRGRTGSLKGAKEKKIQGRKALFINDHLWGGLKKDV